MYWPPSQHFKEQFITQQYNSSLCQCWRIGLHFSRLDLFAVMLVWLGFQTQYHWNTNNNAKLKMSFKVCLCLLNLPIHLFKLLNSYWQCACVCHVSIVSVPVCVHTCLFLHSSTSVTSRKPQVYNNNIQSETWTTFCLRLDVGPTTIENDKHHGGQRCHNGAETRLHG